MTRTANAEWRGDLEDKAFPEHAEEAKENCPVSKALSGCEIRLDARLV